MQQRADNFDVDTLAYQFRTEAVDGDSAKARELFDQICTAIEHQSTLMLLDAVVFNLAVQKIKGTQRRATGSNDITGIERVLLTKLHREKNIKTALAL